MGLASKWRLLASALVILTYPGAANAASGPCWDRYNSCSKKCLNMSNMTECFFICSDIYMECTAGGSGVGGPAAKATLKSPKGSGGIKKPPGGGLLDSGPGFTTVGPSRTGAPLATPPPAGPTLR